MSAAELLRQARRSARLTQAELALRLGTSQPVVARMESRDSNPTWDTLSRALHATGHDVQLAPALATEVGIDLAQLRERLRLSPEQRLTVFQDSQRRLENLRAVARSGRDG